MSSSSSESNQASEAVSSESIDSQREVRIAAPSTDSSARSAVNDGAAAAIINSAPSPISIAAEHQRTIDSIRDNDPTYTELIIDYAAYQANQRSAIVAGLADVSKKNTVMTSVTVNTYCMPAADAATVGRIANSMSNCKELVVAICSGGIRQATPVEETVGALFEALQHDKYEQVAVACVSGIGDVATTPALNSMGPVETFFKESKKLQRVFFLNRSAPWDGFFTCLANRLFEGLRTNSATEQMIISGDVEPISSQLCRLFRQNEFVKTIFFKGSSTGVNRSTVEELGSALNAHSGRSLHIYGQEAFVESILEPENILSNLESFGVRCSKLTKVLCDRLEARMTEGQALAAVSTRFDDEDNVSVMGELLSGFSRLSSKNMNVKRAEITAPFRRLRPKDQLRDFTGLNKLMTALSREDSNLVQLGLVNLTLSTDQYRETFLRRLPKIQNLKKLLIHDVDFTTSFDDAYTETADAMWSNQSLVEMKFRSRRSHPGGNKQVSLQKIDFCCIRNRIRASHLLHFETPIALWPLLIHQICNMAEGEQESNERVVSLAHYLIRERVDLLVSSGRSGKRKGRS